MMPLGRTAVYPRRYAAERSAHSCPSRGRDHQRVGNHSARDLDSPLEWIPGRGLYSQTRTARRLAVQCRRARRRINCTRMRSYLPRFHSSVADRDRKLSQSSHCRVRCGTLVNWHAGRLAAAMVNQSRRGIHDCDNCRIALRTRQCSPAGAFRNLRVDHLRGRVNRPLTNAHQTLLLSPLSDARTSARSPITQARIAISLQVRPLADRSA